MVPSDIFASMSAPTLSIIMPSYNYARYMRGALDSVLKENYRDFELIILEDASSDESPQIAAEYAKAHSCIRYFESTQNKGFFYRAKEGLELARGKYIHIFSPDDLYLPGFLEKLMPILLAHPERSLACSNLGYFEDGSHEIKVKPLHPTSHEIFFSPETIVDVSRATQFWVPSPACIVKKELLLKFGGFDPGLANLSDWYLYNAMAFEEGVTYLPETLLAMRLHPNTYSQRIKRDKKKRRAAYKHLLHTLSQKHNQQLRTKFKRSNLLSFIFKDLSWRKLFYPKFYF